MGNCETSVQPMTPLGTPDSERDVLNHDIRHIDLQELVILKNAGSTNPTIKT